MTFQELFEFYYGANDIEQLGLSARLYHYVKTLAESSSGIRMIKRTLDYQLGGSASVHPDVLITLLERFGFRDWPHLESWLISSAELNLELALNAADPPFPLIQPPEMRGITQIANDIRYAGFPIDPFKIHIGNDRQYGLVADRDIRRIVEACPSDRKLPRKEFHDCDDFTDDLLGWLPRKGFGWLAFFQLDTWLLFENGRKDRHHMCCALSREKNLWLVEPQNDDFVWKWGDTIAWPGVADIEPVEIRK